MRLCLDDLGTLLPTATAVAKPDGSVVVTAPALTLDLSPLGGAPAAGLETGALTTAALGRDCPPGASVRVVSEAPQETVLGWPLHLVHAQVVSAAGTLLEDRLVASYQFLRYTATVLVRLGGTAAVPFATQRPLLTQLLRSGRPDWRADTAGTVAALWDIWH